MLVYKTRTEPCHPPSRPQSQTQHLQAMKAIINLSENPSLPFEGATLDHFRQKKGQLTIEKRAGALYVNGQKIVLRECLYSDRPERWGREVKFYEPRMDFDKTLVASANFLDFLMANPNFVPNEMKVLNVKSVISYICFRQTWYNGRGSSFIRMCYWSDGKLNECLGEVKQAACI